MTLEFRYQQVLLVALQFELSFQERMNSFSLLHEDAITFGTEELKPKQKTSFI